MAENIHLLPDNVANQIAAGEVIQRPASVVKELIENSVDSGADKIQIIIKDSGKTLIQVIDNGKGMSETDARMAFERHATSKIDNAEDLFSIKTKGFRGEALASVAAVASVEMKTRTSDSDIGTKIRVSASNVENQEQDTCPKGTNISVKNLFYNIPARRKFLKTDQTELRHIINEVQRVALAHPDIYFILRHDNKEIFNLGKGKVKQRIVGIFGRQMENNLIDLKVNTDIVKIRGYIGKPEKAKKTTGEQFFFVNRRYMRHGWFYRAVVDAYSRIIPEGSYPQFFIYFDINPDKIDVNIHPTKTEIKFTDERPIYQMLHAGVKEALGRFNIVPSLNFDKDETIDMHKSNSESVKPPQISYDPDYNPFKTNNPGSERFKRDRENIKNWENIFPSENISGNDKEQQTETGINSEESPENNFFQLKNRYIITSVKSGLMLIDQVRAHERVMFESFSEMLKTRQGVVQKSLYPVTINLSPEDSALMMELMEKLTAVGFDLNVFGKNSFVINGIPANISIESPEKIIEELLENYKNYSGDVKMAVDEKLAKAMAETSSKSYIKGLEPEEMKSLFYRLMSCNNHNYSPDGKPIISIISMEELEKRLK